MWDQRSWSSEPLAAFELLLNTSVITREIADPSLSEESGAVILQDEEIFSPFLMIRTQSRAAPSKMAGVKGDQKAI